MATRRERVILELEDNFTTGMARAAAATALLDKNLDHLSGSSTDATRSVGDTNREVGKSSPVFTQASKDIDRYSGRLRLLTEAAVVLGPALVPIGAVAVPAVAALSSGLAAAAASAGVAVLAFHGVGDALKALDEYQLDPSAAHLEKMQEEFKKIGPAGVEFVKFLDDIEPQLKDLQELSRLGLFPGVEAGIGSLLTMMPRLRIIIFDLATEMGKLSAQAGNALSGDGFAAFFDYLETDAAPTLEAFAHTVGFVGQGLASLLVAFAPLSRDFSSGMESMARSFAEWADGLSQTEGFRDFVAYVRESGPQVLDLLGSLATAFINIAQAAAPVGAAVLPALTALANVLSAIAASPIGPPLFTAVAAMLAINRAATLVTAGLDKMALSAERTGSSISGIGRGVVGITAVIGAADLLQNVFDKLNDTSIDSGNLSRSLEALADGRTTDDLGNLFRTFQDVQNGWQADWNPISWVSSWDPSGAESAEKSIKAIDQALAQMVESGDGDKAAAAFAKLQPEAEKAGLSLAELNRLFPQYNTAVANTGPVTHTAADAARKLAIEQNRQADAADKAAHSTKALVGAMQDATDAALGAFDAETQYREALKSATEQAKKNDAGIKGNTDAALANRGALSQLASAWNNQSSAVKNNVKRFHEARQAFIDTATAMGVPIEKAKALADRLMQIPKQRVIEIEARAERAADVLAQIKRQALDVAGEYRINFVVTQTNAFNKRAAFAAATNADGGTVGGQRHPYGDKVLSWLAPGEEVITNRNGEADRFRADRAAGRIPAYAGGGTVASVGAGGTPHWQDDLVHGVYYASNALFQFGNLGEKQLKIRERQFTREEQLAEKNMEALQKRLDEERAALKELRDARRDFMASVTGNFRTDLNSIDLVQAGTSGALGSDFGNSVYAFAQKQGMTGAYNIADWIQQYLDSLTPDQIAALQAHASVGTLHQDTANAEAFQQVLEQLRAMGLHGGAYNQVAQGSLAQAQAYLSMGPDFIRRLMQSFRREGSALQSLGQSVGNARFGADIREQLRVTQHAARVAEQQRDELREIRKGQADLERRMRRVEKAAAETGPDRTASGVGKVINHGSAAANRRPPR